MPKVDPTKITKAVEQGKKIIKDDGTKVDAAMAIFRLTNDLDQKTIVKAFVDGALLTPKGALIYWYNCRWKLKKERSIQ